MGAAELALDALGDGEETRGTEARLHADNHVEEFVGGGKTPGLALDDGRAGDKRAYLFNEQGDSLLQKCMTVALIRTETKIDKRGHGKALNA
jgi:hypothetical protein